MSSSEWLRPRWRTACRAAAVLLLGAGLLEALRTGPHPQRDLDGLAAEVARTEGALPFYRRGVAAAGSFPGRGYVLTVHVGGLPRAGSDRYLTLSRMDGRASGEVMSGGGIRGVRLLEEAELEAYLRSLGLSTERLDRAFARFAERRAPPRSPRAQPPEGAVAGPAPKQPRDPPADLPAR